MFGFVWVFVAAQTSSSCGGWGVASLAAGLTRAFRLQ